MSFSDKIQKSGGIEDRFKDWFLGLVVCRFSDLMLITKLHSNGKWGWCGHGALNVDLDDSCPLCSRLRWGFISVITRSLLGTLMSSSEWKHVMHPPFQPKSDRENSGSRRSPGSAWTRRFIVMSQYCRYAGLLLVFGSHDPEDHSSNTKAEHV